MKLQSANNGFEIDLVEQSFKIGHDELKLYRVKNLDELIDQIDDEQFNHDERMPYWAELWPSAIGLARYLNENPHIIHKKKVLELGCGLGLTSMVIGDCEPEQFLATDYEQDALDITTKNFLLNEKKPPRLKLLDWRAPDLEQKFEVIVAADILYERRFFLHLRRLFRNYLERQGSVILAEPGRPIAQNFFDMLRQAGFVCITRTMEVQQANYKIAVKISRIHKK